MDDPGSGLGDSWPRAGPSAAAVKSERGRTKPHGQRDLVVRGEEAFPPRLALAAARHLGEEPQALVLPLLERVEIAGVVLDERLDERAAVADVAGLVADARAMVDRGQDVAARLGAVGQHGEGAGSGGALGDEVALDQDLDRVVELEQVAEEPARRARRLPRGEPVALGDARALEDLAVHLEMALL